MRKDPISLTLWLIMGKFMGETLIEPIYGRWK